MLNKGTLIAFLLVLTGLVWAQDTIVTPVIEKVTVLNTAGHVGIQWSYPPGQNVDGFIIYIKNPNKYPDPGDSIDVVYGSSTLSYIDLSAMANDSSVYYSVDAFKITGQQIDNSPQSQPHATIFTKAAFDSCQQQNILHWSEYVGWGATDMNYRIYANSTEIGRTSDTFFVHDNIELNEFYRYYILAESSDGRTTASNRTELTTTYPEPPEYINADYASVTNGSIDVSFTLSEIPDSYRLVLVRTVLETGSIDTLETFQPLQENIVYNDNDADILKQYQYRLSAVNSCNIVTTQSNVAGNIVLTAEKQESLIRLTWTSYENYTGGIRFYEIYRDAGNGPTKIGETQTNSFLDNTDNFAVNNPTGTISYYVRAVENSNPFGNTGESNSNSVDVVQDFKIEFPTAFTPNGDGTNDYFRPIDLPFVPQSYNLVIFDRWGMPVFEATTINDEWNGTTGSGKPVMEGVYNYQVEFTTIDGTNHVQTGYVTVLFP